MSEVFLSYAHEDRERILPFVKVLESAGKLVWWDTQVHTGVRFDMEIEAALQSARCVVVVWSERSVNSQWVRSEAHEGLERNILIPVLIDDVKPPMPFGQLQAIDLAGQDIAQNIGSTSFLSDVSSVIAGHREDSAVHVHPHYQKSRRKPPLYRTALLVVLLGILSVLALESFRGDLSPQPGNYFEEPDRQGQTARSLREKVVVANIENLTQDKVFDYSLRHAFVVGLNQSKAVQVLSVTEVQQVLERMKESPGSALTRELAIEVALREQLRVVVTSSIAQVGNNFVLSVEVLDPRDGAVMFAQSEESDSRDHVIGALGRQAVAIRRYFGEVPGNDDGSALPLEKVTTASIDALKAYTLALSPLEQADGDQPIELLKRAIELDPEFAMAHAKLAAQYTSRDEDFDKAREHWQLALEQADRLSARELVYIQASSTWGKSPAERVKAWKLMSSLFPDEVVGHHNLAMVYWENQNRFDEAEHSMRKAAVIDQPWQFISMHSLGNILVGQGELNESLEWFNLSVHAGDNPLDWGKVDALVILGRYEEATEFLGFGLAESGSPESFDRERKRIGFLIEQGLLPEAVLVAEQKIRQAREMGLVISELRFSAALLAMLERNGSFGNFEQELNRQAAILGHLIKEDHHSLRFTPASALALLGKIAARNGYIDLAQSIGNQVVPSQNSAGDFFWNAYFELLQAEISIARGDVTEGIRLVDDLLEQSDLFQAHETLARAYKLIGDTQSAQKEWNWMMEHHGLALAENMSKFYGREFNMLDRLLAGKMLAAAAGTSAADVASGFPSGD